MIATLNSYAQLDQVATSFADGDFNLLLVLGSAGLGKTTTIKAATRGTGTVVLEGQLSALGLYRAAYEAQDQPIVIDDVDRLYADPASVRILKLLCQTEDVKTLGWHTASHLIGEKEGQAPSTFETSSPVCIIANEFQTANPNTIAIADRGLTVDFEPSPDEVHRQVGRWFKDKEVYAYIGRNVDQIIRPSQRSYYTASMMRTAGLDWKNALITSWRADTDLIALRDVYGDEILTTAEARCRAWIQLTGKTRASYYRLCKSHPQIAALRGYNSSRVAVSA